MRLPMVAGNWKMNTTVAEAQSLVKDMRDRLDRIGGVEKVVCPPFVSLTAVSTILSGTSIKLGAQNMHFMEKGAFTGEVSPLMLTGMCDYVILGHSERRQYFGESNEVVNKKVKAALKVKLNPILCVGENLEQREKGNTEEVIRTQLAGSLAGITNIDGLVIAYEPIWAIGTGKAATGQQANETIGFMRRQVDQVYGKEAASRLRVLYGGSVTGANVQEFIRQPEIDGGLVGGASLNPIDFISITEQAASAKKT